MRYYAFLWLVYFQWHVMMLHSAGSDLMYLTVCQVKSRWNQRDFTLVRLPLSHKEHMFLFCPLCVLPVCKFGIKPKLWTRAISPFAVYICLFHQQRVNKLCQSIYDSVHHMARLLKLRGLNCVWNTQVLYCGRIHCML